MPPLVRSKLVGCDLNTIQLFRAKFKIRPGYGVTHKMIQRKNLEGFYVFSPAIDIHQRNNHVVMTASLPAAKADEVQVNISGDTFLERNDKRSCIQLRCSAWWMRLHTEDTNEHAVMLVLVLGILLEIITEQTLRDFISPPKTSAPYCPADRRRRLPARCPVWAGSRCG